MTGRPNRSLIEYARGAEKIIILTGRCLEYDEGVVRRKLKRFLDYDELILCPRGDLIKTWKTDMALKIATRHGGFEWYDDDFRGWPG
jgi:hypothetical protein